MADDLFAELARKIRILTEAMPTEAELNPKRRLPRSALPLSDEDMDKRLLSIRHHITPKELAGLMHWHLETVYRKAKKGMPVERDLDLDGRGRLLKIYPPQIAEWRRQCREARKHLIQSSQVSSSSTPPSKKETTK